MVFLNKLIAPSNCPVCGGEFEITKLTCKNCKSELNGHFEGCEFCGLSESDKYFMLAFIKCRGNIKEVEKELGISYPTVRGKLDTLITNLGLELSQVDKESIKEERKKILEQLESGQVTAAEAVTILKGLK